MPIETTLTSHKFLNQFTNLEDFSANLSDFTENLAGGTIESIKVVSQIEITWVSESSQSDIWEIDFTPSVSLVISRSSGNFRNDGLLIGGLVHLFEGVNFRNFGNVESINESGNTIVITTTNTGGFSDGNYTNASIKPIVSDATNSLTSLIYGFGIIGANETYNTLSKVSQNPQGYYFTNLSIGGGAQTGIAKGTFNDWVTGSMTCERLADADTYTQAFEISHIFRIEPHYVDGELTNLENNVLPDLYKASLKYAFDVDFRTVLSNPNKSIKATYDNTLGSVGWFNQNFNGFDNQYQIDSIEYEDSALATDSDGLQLSSKTKATITVSRIGGVILAGQRAGVFVSYLPAQSEYQDTATTLSENYLLDSIYHNEGTTAEVGTGIIKSFNSSIVSDNLVIVVEFEYTTAQQLRLTTDSGYLIAVQIADSALSSGNSNRVNLIADTNTYQKGAFIEGLFDVTTFNYLVNGETVADLGNLEIAEIWNEDSLSAKGTFDLDLSKDSVLNSIEFVLVAFNTVTNSYFTLDLPYFINTANATVSGGVQQIEVIQNRGYSQLYEEDFNNIEITTGSKVGDLQSYSFLFGQKIRWQDWLNNPNADTVFFDNTKPKDNLNFKSSNYSALNDYQIKMVVIGRTSGTDDLGRAGIGFDTVEGGNITVKDYGVSDIAYTVSEVATFDPDTLVNLNGSILSDKPTLLESRFSVGVATSTSNKVILHRYEKTNQLGGVIPEVEADLSIEGTDLVGKTLFDSSLFEQGVAYNFTARLFSPFQIFSFEFQTTWDTGVDGVFDPIILGGAKTWVLGTDTVIADNPNYTGSYLDGTLKTVTVLSPDFALISSIDFEDYKVEGDLDFSLFTGSPDLLIDENTTQTALSNSITNLIIPTSGVDSFACRFYQGTALSLKVNGGGFQIDFSPNLSNLDFEAGTNVSSFSATILPSLLNIDLSNVQHLGGTFDLNTTVSVVTDLILNTIDSSNVTRINFTGRKIRQVVDLGNYNMAGVLNLLNCEITSLTTPTGALTGATNIRGNRFSQFDSSLVFNGTSFAGGTAGDLNELIRLASGNITVLNASGGSLNEVDFGTAVISSTTVIFSLADNAMTTAEVDAVWIELDRVAIVTGIARVLNVGGNNDAPSAVSLSARNSLIGKGYLLTI